MAQRQLRERARRIVPDLVDYTDRIVLGEVWKRAGLSARDRSLATIAALIAMGRSEALADHLVLGRSNGLTEEELREVVTHLAFYAGWPAAMSAAMVLGEPA